MEGNDLRGLLNQILNNYVPRTKINKFIKLLEEYQCNTSDLTLFEDQKEKETPSHKIPLEKLKQRLSSDVPSEDKAKDEDIKDIKDLETTLYNCDHYEKKIRQHEITGKKYYHRFGYYLSQLKLFLAIEDHSQKEINIFIQERYHIKVSTINKYIRFSGLCDKYEILLDCDLSYREIMNNIPEIEELLSDGSR